MAISQELISLLVCPESKQKLALAEAHIVDSFNAKTSEGTLLSRGKKNVDQAVSALLLREDGKFVYPVRNDIPILLIDEAVSVDQL